MQHHNKRFSEVCLLWCFTSTVFEMVYMAACFGACAAWAFCIAILSHVEWGLLSRDESDGDQ